MADIRIHVFHTGEVCVAPDLPFGGDNSNAIKASGVFGKKEDRLWLPVSAYLIEHPKGKFLVDTGWAREMSPNGEFDKKAQIRSLGSVILYEVNQGRIGLGECIDEQLAAMGIKDTDIDAVLLTHLDCDHANGLPQVKGAKKFLVSADELKFASKATNRVRYYKGWWKDTPLTTFEWNDTEGPVGKSYDLLGDGSIELINIPGHADGLFAVKVKNEDGKFVLLFSDVDPRAEPGSRLHRVPGEPRSGHRAACNRALRGPAVIMSKHTALITGASGGLGLEFARICASKKYDLVLVARNEGKLYAIKNDLESAYGVKVHVCAADLSVTDAALDVFDFCLEHKLPVDILVNNAGFGDAGAFADRDWQKQYEMVQVNIVALMQLTHCFLKPMMEQGYGKILNLSSVAAFSAGPDMSVYYATKAFVRSFSEAIAEEVRGTGVTVTAICPGPTATGFEKAAAMKNGSAMFRKAASAATVAEAGIRAMERGKVLLYQGAFTKLAGLGARIAPRSVTRKFARKMNH